MNITEFRKQYPQYEDMSDKQLADSLYQKHYSDIPRAEFDSKFTPKSFMDKAKDVAGAVGKSFKDFAHGVSEVAGHITPMPLDIANFAGGIADSIVQEDLSKENRDKNIQSRAEATKGIRNFLSGMGDEGPVTPEGRTAQGIFNAAMSIPQAAGHALGVVATPQGILPEKVERNLKGGFEILGELGAYELGGKIAKSGRGIVREPGVPADIPFDPSRRINQEAKAVQPDLNLGDVQYTTKPRVEDAAATNRWYEAEANTRDEVANAMADGRERVARDKTLAQPVGEPTGGPVVDRYVKEPQLNDMPQPQTVQGLLPYDKMGRIDEAKSTFDLDAQRLAEEIANAKEERAVSLRNEALGRNEGPLYNPDGLSPTSAEPVVKANVPNVSIDDAKVAKAEVVKQLLTEKNPDRISQLEIQLDHYNQIIKGDATYKDFQPATSEVRGAETQPSVTKATVGEVLDMIRNGEINAKEHTTLYPDGVRNPASTAYVFNKKSLGKDIVTAKKEVVQGGELESKWLGKKEEVATIPKVEPTEVVEPKVVEDPTTTIPEKEKATPTEVKETPVDTPSEPKVKRASDFKDSGNYDVTLSDGTTYKIFRDTENGGYYLDGTGHYVDRGLAAWNRKDAISSLQKMHDTDHPYLRNAYKESVNAVDVGKGITEESKMIPEPNLEASDSIVEDNSTPTTGPTDAELAAIERESASPSEVQDDLFIPEKGIDYGVGKERKSKAEERLARIKAASEAKAATKETAPLENAELYAGIPINRLPKALNTALVSMVKGMVKLSHWVTPTTPRTKFVDMITLPQRIAASGKYPTYTKMYNEAYRVWEEERTQIINKLYEEYISPDNPLDSRMGAKEMRKMQNKLSGPEMLDYMRLLKESEQVGRRFSPEELAGTENPFGRSVSDNVAKLYDSTRKFYQDIAMEDLNQNLQTAMESFRGQTWFRSLKDWVDNEWTRQDVEALADEHNILIHKDALGALDTVNKVRANNAEILKGYEENPQYFPHVRPNGEYAVRVFELNDAALEVRDKYQAGEITKEEYIKVLKDTSKEVYMRTAFNEAEQRGLLEKVRNDPMNDELGYPANYKRMLEERAADKLVEGVDYEILTDNLHPTNEEVWIYSGSMPAKVSLMETMIQNAFSDKAALKRMNKKDAEALGARVDTDVRDALHHALTRTLTDAQLSRGFGRHKMQRAGHLIEGFDMSDPVGTALNHARTMSGYHTKARYAMTAARLFKDASYEEHILLSRFLQDTLGNENAAMARAGALVRQGLVLTQLAYRPIAPIINLTQMFAWGAPEMAARLKREGINFKGVADVLIAKAGADIARQWGHEFTSKIANPNKYLTPIERRAIEEFSRTGAAEASNIREVSGMGEGAHIKGLSKATEWGMKPFSISETMNREAIFLSSFREYMKGGKSFAESFEKAKNLSLEVNIDASKHNNPGLVRRGGALAKTFYTFGRYSHSYLSWMFQQASVHGDFTPAARALLVLTAIGGVTALPLVNETNEVAEKMFGKSYKLDLIKYLKKQGEATGSPSMADTVEDFVMHGAAGAVFGADVSRSLSPSIPILSNLITNGSFDQATVGPISSVFQRTSRMGQAISRGDTSRAIENIPILPQGLANPLAAYRQYTQGVTTAQGKPVRGTDGSVLKMTGSEALMKGVVGATPLRVGREQEITGSQYSLKDHYQEQVKNLRSKWVNSPEDRTEIKKELREISKSVKEYGLDLKVPKRFEKWEKPSREEKRGKALYRRGDAN